MNNTLKKKDGVYEISFNAMANDNYVAMCITVVDTVKNQERTRLIKFDRPSGESSIDNWSANSKVKDAIEELKQSLDALPASPAIKSKKVGAWIHPDTGEIDWFDPYTVHMLYGGSGKVIVRCEYDEANERILIKFFVNNSEDAAETMYMNELEFGERLAKCTHARVYQELFTGPYMPETKEIIDRLSKS